MERCISHPFDFKEDSDMKKEYDTSVKEAIERVMSVFSEYIKTTPYFDIVWSGISTSASIVAVVLSATWTAL